MRAITLAISFFLVLGCGGDDDAAGSGGSSVPGGTKITALTAQQASELCMFAERTYKDALPSEDAYCTASAASDADSSEDCKQYVQDCRDFKEYEDDVNEDWDCANADKEEWYDGECEATVAEFEDCFRGRARVSSQYAKTASCDDPSSLGPLEDPAECKALLDHCPDPNF